MKKVAKSILCIALLFSCMFLTSCQLIWNSYAVQDKIIAAAKTAVTNMAYAKIDARENLDDETKAFLKEVAKELINRGFDRLKDEYRKKHSTQKEIEEDMMSKFVEPQMEAMFTSSYLKSVQKTQQK